MNTIKKLLTFNLQLSTRSGMAALPVVLLLGGFITEIVVVLMATSYLSLGTELGIRLSADAYFAARSGVNDGLMKIVRDKNFTSSAYTLTVGNAVAQVTVCKDAPCTDNGKSKITSIGITQSRTRRFEAVVVVNPLTGEATLESLEEITQTAAPSGSGLRVFVTSAVYNGNLGGLSGADSKCQALAIAASLGGTWKAWLSTNSISASSRLVHETSPYKLVNGVVIADNWADLTDGSLAASINVTETGVNSTAGVAWTNTAIDGSSAYTDQYDCAGWTENQPFPGSSGTIGSIDGTWTMYGTPSCSQLFALYCFEQSGTVPTPPNLIATGEIGQIALNWSVPSSDGGKAITNYKIYRGLTSGSEEFLIMIGNVLTYMDSGVADGTTYYYKVSAVNAVGESLMSNEVSARSASIPDAPTNLAGTGGYRQVALTWTAASPNGSAVTNYKIYKGLSSGSEVYFATIGNLTNYTDTGLDDNTHYYYKVLAINALGEGPLSNEADVRTATIPDSPIGLEIYSGDKQILFSWQPPANDGGSSITSYKIYRGPGFDELINIGSVDYIQTPDSLGLGKEHYWHDTNLINGTYYFYRVTAVNAVGESWMSGGEFAAAGAPGNLSATPGNTAVNLSWSVPVGSPTVSYWEIWRGASSDNESYLTWQAYAVGTTYRDTSPPLGVTNYYKIKAVYPDASSAFSNEASNRYIWQATGAPGMYGETCNAWLLRTGYQGTGPSPSTCTISNGEPNVTCNERLSPQPACVYYSDYYDIRVSSMSPDTSDLQWYPKNGGAFYNNPGSFETIYTYTLR